MPFSMADILAGYGGSPDPENPSSGQITPGLLLRALQQADVGGSQAFGKMATDIATLPRRAIEGAAQYSPGIRREDVTDVPGTSQPADVAVAPATEAAMNLAGFGTMFAQPGSAGIFGGRLAKTANLEKLAQAEDMAAKGASKQEIWDKTGWFQGAEGAWRFEIPDATSRMSQRIQENFAAGKASRPGTIGTGFEHPDLYAAYPELANIPLKMSDPSPTAGYMARGGVRYMGGTPDYMMINSPAFTEEMSKKLGDLVPGPEGMRVNALHELQHLVQNIEGTARGGTPLIPEVKNAAQSYILNRRAELRAEMADLGKIRDAWMAKNPGPIGPETVAKFNADNPGVAQRAMEVSRELGSSGTSEYRNDQLFKHYQKLAGEVESANVEARADFSPAERKAKAPWETQSIPFSEQLLRLSEGPGLGAKQLQTYPSFSERMGAAQDQAFTDRQRGKTNILPREVTNEPPLLAPGETRGDLVDAMTPGMPPAETSIADVGRNAYRGFEPGPSSVADVGQREYRARLGLTGPRSTEIPRPGQQEFQFSTRPLPEVPEASGPISGVGRPFRQPEAVPTVDRPRRIAAPGIYGDPRDIAAQALGQVSPEHPALRELFGVSRGDLEAIAMARKGNLDPYTLLPGWKPGATGSAAAEAVMNPRNAQRLQDILAESMRIPELRQGMVPWYVMDPAYQRLESLVGPEQARQIYTPANILTSMASPGSPVQTELTRGTAASMLANQGRFPLFEKYGGRSMENRGRGFPPELADVPGHVYHSTSQAGPMADYLRTGQIQMESPKVPLYIGASGVPQTGFQTGLPIPDVHFTGGLGMFDTRGDKRFRRSMQMAEFQSAGPWYAENVAKPVGLEPVYAQALQWGALAPHTGVETLIGAPKLELLAQNVWERAKRLGMDPQRLLDLVLQRQAHAAVPIAGAAGAAAASMREGE